MHSSDFAKLPADQDAALLEFIEEGVHRASTATLRKDDFIYEPWVQLAAAVNGITREIGLSIPLRLQPGQDETWEEWRRGIGAELESLRAQLAFRTKRGGAAVVEPVLLNDAVKDEVRSHTRRIRALLNKLEMEEKLRQLLLQRLNAFEASLDFAKTPWDGFLALFLDTTKAVRQGAEDLEPAMDLLERIAALMHPETVVKLLAAPAKALPKPKPKPTEDEIPF